jgi:MYXO-CTERM domain-containing protein
MQTSKLVRSVLGSIGIASVTLYAAPAAASREFPGAIQEAAGIPCVPSCILCHGEAVGRFESFQARALSRGIAAKGIPAAHDTAALKASFALFAMDPANKDAVADLKAGIDPETGDSLCGPTYGCGAHVAKQAPPTDFWALPWVVGAVVAGALSRRRRRPNVF